MNNNRKEQLKNNLMNENSNLTYSYLILKMLNKGTLNNLIEKITDTKTKINVTTLLQKNYLEGNEQFLYLINNLIYQFNEDFYFLQNNFEKIVEIILQNEKYTKYLLCKKYIGNNNYITFFSNNSKKLITNGFYTNIKKLTKKSEIIKNFLKDNNINTIKYSFNNNQNLKNLYNALIKLTICNAKNTNIYILFEDIKKYTNTIPKENKNTIYNYYIFEIENMIKNYYKKIDAINVLLK